MIASGMSFNLIRSHIYDLVPDPTSPRVMLLVTKYLDHSGSFLCVPIISKEAMEIKIQFSAMRFVKGVQLHFGEGKVGVPDETVWAIQDHIIRNEDIFKDRIKNFKEVMSDNREGFPSC